jgi:hypothetical protein
MTDTCSNCGQTPVGEGCYHICFNSTHFYSPEQEREDDRWSASNRDHITEAYAATAEPSQYADEGWRENDTFNANPDGSVTLVTGTGGEHTYDPDDIPF